MFPRNLLLYDLASCVIIISVYNHMFVLRIAFVTRGLLPVESKLLSLSALLESRSVASNG